MLHSLFHGEAMNDIVRVNPMGGKLSDAVEHNGLIYLAGQVAEKLDAGMKQQTEDVLRQIDALLARCGSDKSRILSATVYVNDMKKKPQMDEAWMAWVDRINPPARATVEVQLGSPDTLVEIMCVAAKRT
jgi:enamine deaminase RidA (YjgF/YER057c/UK114 family)